MTEEIEIREEDLKVVEEYVASDIYTTGKGEDGDILFKLGHDSGTEAALSMYGEEYRNGLMTGLAVQRAVEDVPEEFNDIHVVENHEDGTFEVFDTHEFGDTAFLYDSLKRYVGEKEEYGEEVVEGLEDAEGHEFLEEDPFQWGEVEEV